MSDRSPEPHRRALLAGSAALTAATLAGAGSARAARGGLTPEQVDTLAKALGPNAVKILELVRAYK